MEAAIRHMLGIGIVFLYLMRVPHVLNTHIWRVARCNPEDDEVSRVAV